MPADTKHLFRVPIPPAGLPVWIHSIYVVTFDIEFGQAIENQYPPHNESELTELERNNICYSSFPDSNSAIIGSTQFQFRMRLSNLDDKLREFYSYYNTQTTQALCVDTNFIYGYVHFLQRKEPSFKRGYFQKSLVILSLLPYSELFKHIVTVIGTNYFDNEHLLNLENVYNQIKKWPWLQTGTLLNLTIMGSTMAFYIPNKDDKLNSLHANLSPTSTSFVNKIRMIKDSKNGLLSANTIGHSTTTVHGTPLAIVSQQQDYHTILTAFDLDLYECFYPVISDLQLLWEMILTCEPFIVITHTPDVCSNFVKALISLIYPFKYNADHRPFFTIHDPEFKDYVGSKSVQPRVTLGVTNPFFTKSLEHWPNVIQLCNMTSSKSSDQLCSLISSFSSMATQTQQDPHQTKIHFVDRLRFTTTETLRPGLNTKFKPYLQKDRNFLTKILRSNKAHVGNRPNNVQTALIRRWLIELTQSFFMPLERYLTQLMPLHNKISPFKAPPELPLFDIDAFLTTVDTSGPHLTTKIRGDWYGLYKRFFDRSNFKSWYDDRKNEIDRKLWMLHMESFLDLDLPQAVQDKGEVEVVDMIIQLRRRFASATNKFHEYNITFENLDQFKQKLAELINTLPEDLRSIFSHTQ